MSPLPLVEQHVPGSTSTTRNFPKQKKLSILGYTWHKHIFAKRKHLGITLSKMYWLQGRKSKLFINNKLLAYKVILKPIWTYGIQLWGLASISNIEILERFQGKVLRMITDAPWYVPNMVLRQDLQIASVNEEVHRFSTQYRVHLYTHPNNLTVPPDHRRLRRHLPISLHPHLATGYLEHKHIISLRNSLTFTVAAARPPLRKLTRRLIRASVSTSDAKESVASKPWSALHHLLYTFPILNLLYSVLNL
jgi:hypothetical protein